MTVPAADGISAALRGLSPEPVDPSPVIRTALPFYGVSLRELERVARAWLREHPGASAARVLGLADELWSRAVREEMVTATFLVGLHPGALGRFGARRIDRWGRLLDTWETTDNLGGRVVGPWVCHDADARVAVLERLAGRRNPYLRRLALVGCVSLARLDDPGRWWPATSAIVLRLAGDREASIPKAISWVLRSHLRGARSLVIDLLEEQGDALPAIARREVRTKLATGTKTGRRGRGSQPPASR
jgi:3-methyladenine DNA glycosylase AlkD